MSCVISVQAEYKHSSTCKEVVDERAPHKTSINNMVSVSGVVNRYAGSSFVYIPKKGHTSKYDYCCRYYYYTTEIKSKHNIYDGRMMPEKFSSDAPHFLHFTYSNTEIHTVCVFLCFFAIPKHFIHSKYIIICAVYTIYPPPPCLHWAPLLLRKRISQLPLSGVVLCSRAYSVYIPVV